VADGDGCKDLAWFHPGGREMASDDWFDTGLRTLGMYLDGRGLRHRDRRLPSARAVDERGPSGLPRPRPGLARPVAATVM